MTTKKKYVVDLFAGCGGLSLGLERADFHPVFVNELNKDAMASYLKNRSHVEERLAQPEFHINDIKQLVTTRGSMAKLSRNIRGAHGIDPDQGDLDLVVGGPPCQGFSGIGHRRFHSVNKEQLPSNHLYQDMAWVISKLKPKIFLFENVKGLMSARWTPSGQKGEIFEDVLETFRSLNGYSRVEPALVLAKQYGAPQNRPRVLVVGVRDDINIGQWDSLNSGVAKGYLPKPLNMSPPDIEDILGDLIDPEFERADAEDRHLESTDRYPHKAEKGIQTRLRTLPSGKVLKKGDLLTEQEYSAHSSHVKRKFRHMLTHGGEIPDDLKTKKFAQRVLPARWGNAGPTITVTSLADDYVHYKHPRVLTVREWARLQGFPDWYQFAGSRTTGGLRRAGNPREGVFDRELPKYTQIGNAVPVFLAEELGKHFGLVV